MIKRIPMIVFVLTILSLVYMIIVRLNGMGLRLLSMNSSAGRFIAGHYRSCVILFIVMLAILALVVFIANRIRSGKKTVGPDEEEQMFTPPAPELPQNNG